MNLPLWKTHALNILKWVRMSVDQGKGSIQELSELNTLAERQIELIEWIEASDRRTIEIIEGATGMKDSREV